MRRRRPANIWPGERWTSILAGVRRRRGPASIVEQVDFGVAELAPDADRPGCWTLLIDGAPQSHVDLGAPARLHFDYMRRLGYVVDAVAPSREPLRVLHLGGGALALARYVAATRPGSAQLVVERDSALIALVRRVLPLAPRAGIKVRVGDAVDQVAALGSRRFDLILTDVFCGVHQTQQRFAEIGYAAAVARALRPGGVHAANVIDGPPLALVRQAAAAARSVFANAVLIADQTVLRGKHFGNFVLVSGDRLPVAKLVATTGREPMPGRVLHGAELDLFAGVSGTRRSSPAAPR